MTIDSADYYHSSTTCVEPFHKILILIDQVAWGYNFACSVEIPQVLNGM